MICIYHSRDLDGYCSGAIVKKKYPDCKLIGYDYGQPVPYADVPYEENLIIVDVSFPMAHMFNFAKSCNSFVWIDHHASAIKEYNEYLLELTGENPITAVLEDGIAACEGVWKYLFPDEDMPNTVKWLGEYDTWRNSNKSYWENTILPFQYGMRLGVTSAENFPQMLLGHPADYVDTYPEPDIYVYEAKINEIFIQGHTILTYQKEQNTMAMRGSFVIEWEGLRVLACNGGGFNSQVFESVWDESIHDCMMPFRFDGKKWSFSLYTTKDIDLSIIAKKYGGGGHKKACGFQFTELPTFLFGSQ